jgi:hypothetical protein
MAELLARATETRNRQPALKEMKSVVGAEMCETRVNRLLLVPKGKDRIKERRVNLCVPMSVFSAAIFARLPPLLF